MSLVSWIEQYTKMSVALGRDSDDLAMVIQNLATSVSEPNVYGALLQMAESMGEGSVLETQPGTEDLMEVDAISTLDPVKSRSVTHFRSSVEATRNGLWTDEKKALSFLKEKDTEHFWTPVEIGAVIQSAVIEDIISCLGCPFPLARKQAHSGSEARNYRFAGGRYCSRF